MEGITKTVKVFLYFPPDRTGEPLAYRLVKDFDLTFNILHAEIAAGKTGRLTLELSGLSEKLDAGLAYLQNMGIQTRIFSKNILWEEDRCVSCGACTAVCPSNALHISADTNWALAFDAEKCLVCEQCVRTCPMKAIDVDVFV